MRRVLSALLCVFSVVAQAVPAGAAWQASEDTRALITQSLDSRWSRLFDHGELRKGQTSIDTAAFALDAVAVGYDAQKITQALNALVAMQDIDPASRSYGNMRWYQGDEKLVDRNGVEFVMRRLALISLLFPDRLNATQSAALDKVMTFAKTGITKHDVRISYTNIFLMKTWNLIAMGEALHDEALAAQGRGMLRDWLTYTARTGINEFLSPTYFEVDLDNLSLIANLSNDAATRQMANDGLAFFWHDIALHWYVYGMRLGGVHSRDYDRLFNVAALNTKMAETGWLDKAQRSVDQRGPYEFYAWAQPPEAARQWLNGPFPRFISERWGEEPEKRLSHYMGHAFGISSAESGYTAGHDNAPLVINMGSGADVPIIDFFMDGRRDHYGTNKTLEAGSGHMKALHLKPFISSVQNDGEVLFVASIQNDIVNNAALESIMTLPADAEYWLDDKPLKLFSASSKWNYDVAPNGDSTQIIVKDTGKDGHAEALLTDRDDKLGVGISRYFDVIPGKDYRVAASMQGGDVYLYLNFYDAERHLIGGEHVQKVSAGATDFAERTYSYTAPPGAVSCKAWLYSTSTNKTSLRINDLRFEEMNNGHVAKLLGGFDFHEYKAEQMSVPVGATLTLRREDVAVALRLINGWDVQGRNVPFTLYNDGLQYHAMRLTAQHAEGGTAGRGSIAVWAYAEEGVVGDAAFEAFRRKAAAVNASVKLDGDQMDVSVRGITGPSRIVADVAKGNRILRKGMKPVPADAVMWVNGKDVGREILGAYAE